MQTSSGMKHSQNKPENREEIQKFDSSNATKVEIRMQIQHQWQTSNQKSPTINLSSTITTKWRCGKTRSSTAAPHTHNDKQAPLSRPAQCFHGCCTSLFLFSSLHSTEHCCLALCSRPRSPRRAGERGSEGWGGGVGRSGSEVEKKTMLSQRETE